MKKYFLFALILLSVSSLNAQITITESDFSAQFSLGRKITTFATFSLTSANIGSPGATTWDFSGLVSEMEWMTESMDKNSSTYLNDFPNAQYASYYEGTFSGLFSQTWVYHSIGPDFYIDGTGTFTSPFGVNTTTKVLYAPKRRQFQLPVSYNSAWNSSGTQTIQSTMTLPVIGTQTITTTHTYASNDRVDAYGTVVMPGGKVLNALRVRTAWSLANDTQNITSVTYLILTNTGESVAITVKDTTSNSGLVAIDAINWTNGNGVSIPSGVEETDALPTAFSLSQNYPNPFNPATSIRFEISNSGFVSLKVYDVFGRDVATLVNEYKPAGNHDVKFDASRLSGGIYFYELQTGSFTSTKKMVLMK